MKRRDFINNATIIAAGSFFAANCRVKSSTNNSYGETKKFELEEITIDELQAKLKSGEYTSEQITNLYLKQIEAIDKKGPSINSVIELNPEAVTLAKAMDEERKQGKWRGPLHGVPVLLKDNIDTADKMMTTAGSLALVGNKASKDAFIVQQLRTAGAIILGKANLSEWANFRSTRSSSGWSSRGGQTKNPYILDRSPCGSSSGSAVAVAANLCAVSVGTETDGSIACPASMNGVVGIKPTVGLVSRSGIIPISKTQDTAGPFARTVRDAAILLGVLAGIDENDSITAESQDRSKADYTAFLNAEGLKGKRIGIEKTFLKKHEAIDVLFLNAINQMKTRGAEIVEVEFINKPTDVGSDEFKILQYEFKDGLNKYLSGSNAKVKSLEEIIRFNKQNEKTVMPYFKQEIMDSSQVKGNLQSKDYLRALSNTLGLRKFIDRMLEENKLDALCGPATGASWCIDVINGDHWTGYGAYSPAAVAGYPSITVPMGQINQLPIGISFLGKAYDEPGLLAIAFAYEQASNNRRPPQFKNTFI